MFPFEQQLTQKNAPFHTLQLYVKRKESNPKPDNKAEPNDDVHKYLLKDNSTLVVDVCLLGCSANRAMVGAVRTSETVVNLCQSTSARTHSPP
jgi:hypothetical protein